jgi:ABC-type multidrug transport system permease subunit
VNARGFQGKQRFHLECADSPPRTAAASSRPLTGIYPKGASAMLWTIILILLILWLLGYVAFPVGGSLIHLLLVIALILVIVRLAQGRRVI